jgi:hypothetical protein
MAVAKRHSVKANPQIFSLSKAGTSLELEVFEQKTRTKRSKIGTVIIGRGSLTWKKRRGQIGTGSAPISLKPLSPQP